MGGVLPKPKKAAQLLEEAGRWIAAKDLLHLIENATQEAVAAWESQPLTVELARRLHDVILASTVFGHLPPLRLSCIRSLRHFLYTGKCAESACIDDTCHGNIVVLHSREPLQMSFHLPHHKNEAAWGHHAIQFTLPPAYAQLVYAFLGELHLELCRFHNFCDEHRCTFAFMNNKGQGFDNPTFSVYWTKWLQQHGGPALPPSMCRQVFVEERRSDARVAGPSDEGASLIMGHKVSQWDAWYDTHFHSRLGQKAVDHMISWRQALLQDVAQPAATLASVMQASSEVAESGYMSCTSASFSDGDDIDIDID